jgi:hypothetical protein
MPNSAVIKLSSMAMEVKRKKFDPESGAFQYHLVFKRAVSDSEVRSSVPVEVAFSVTENGDLADVSFTLPKSVRNEEAVSFITQEESASYVDSRVFIVVPRTQGDAVLNAPAELELDSAGRIVSMRIH